MVRFRIKAGAPAGGAVVNLLHNLGGTYSQLGGIDANGRDFAFDIEPGLSNDAGDSADGLVTVV